MAGMPVVVEQPAERLHLGTLVGSVIERRWEAAAQCFAVRRWITPLVSGTADCGAVRMTSCARVSGQPSFCRAEQS
jgi:hypothetical protein